MSLHQSVAARPLPRRVARVAERVAWGSERRRVALERLLRGHYASRVRREWSQVAIADVPHYFDHRVDALELAVGDGSADVFLRAFFTLDVLREGDRVLDIGCGDGFYDRHFLAPRCAAIDAVDVEASAVLHARGHQAHDRVRYHRLDAVHEPFPARDYDVICFDGAIGHFAAATTDRVIEKVAAVLRPGGVFVGSESLGREGSDHLQFFETLADLEGVFTGRFSHVRTREVAYDVGGVRRREGFWRAALDAEGAARGAWTDAPGRRAAAER